MSSSSDIFRNSKSLSFGSSLSWSLPKSITLLSLLTHREVSDDNLSIKRRDFFKLSFASSWTPSHYSASSASRFITFISFVHRFRISMSSLFWSNCTWFAKEIIFFCYSNYRTNILNAFETSFGFSYKFMSRRMQTKSCVDWRCKSKALSS